MLYADVATGFRQGMRGMNDEKLMSYQIGIKNRLFDNNGYIKNIEDYPVKAGAGMGSTRLGDPRTYGVVLAVYF